MATNSPSPMPGAAEFSLTPQGEFAGKPPIKLVKPIVLIGSEEHCHLRLASSSVSRHHAMIVRELDRVYVYDLGSRTKVLVNRKEQRQAELADGDKVRIGKFAFKFAASRSPAGPAARPEPIRIIADGHAAPTLPENRLVLIGRTDGSDVVLVEASVSARHAVIFEVGAKRYVRDLDSRTGTFLNGKKIHQHDIKPGDELRIGETTLKLEAAQETAELAEAAPVALDEPLPIEPVPISVADEVEPAAAAEDAIPLGFMPSEQVEEPAIPVEEHPLDLPPPLELEPEPVAVDRSDEPLELEPEFPAKEPEAPAPPAALEVVHPDETAPIELEPEPAAPAEEVVLPAIAGRGDVNEETHLDLQPPASEAEPAEQPAPLAETSDAPEIPLPPVEAETARPDVRTRSELDLLAELEAKPREEFKHVDFELEPAPEAAPAESVAVSTGATINLSDAPSLAEPEPEPVRAPESAEPIPAAATINLSDIPSLLEHEPEPAPESAEPITSDATINLSDAPSLVEPEPEPVSAPAPAEPIPSAATINLSDAPSLIELEPEASPVPEATESPAADSDATIDLSDAPALSEIEPEPTPGPEPAEPAVAPIDATVNLSDAPSLLELEPEPVPDPAPADQTAAAVAPMIPEPEPQPTSPDAAATSIPVSDSKTIDLDVNPAAVELEAENAPINFDPAPTVEETIIPPPEFKEIIEAAEASAEASVEAEPPPQKSPRGRKRLSPAEPKPPKIRKPRTKRVAPKTAEEEASESAPIPAASQPPIEEPSPVEIPELTVDAAASAAAEQTPDSSQSISLPISADMTLTAHEDVVATEPIDAAAPPDSSPSPVEPIAEITLTAHEDVVSMDQADAAPPVEPPAADAAPVEPPPVAPAPLPPPRPFMSVGAFAHLTGGTVNVDHSLGGMPITLPDLPPAPTGFGQVRVSLSGKASSPFSSFARSEPLVFDEPDEIAPPPPQPLELAEPESIVTEPEPPAPEPVEAQLEPVVTPPPLPPVAQALLPGAPAPAVQPPPKLVSSIPRGPRRYTSDRRQTPASEPRPQKSDGGEAFGQMTTAFDGLAPAFRVADAFSNTDAVPLNDAAFGGARLSRSDDYHVPESPEAAARQANGPEYDFADDEFWSRTDEDDGVPPMNIPPAPAARTPEGAHEPPDTHEPMDAQEPPNADHENLAAAAEAEMPIDLETPAKSVEPPARVAAESIEPDAQMYEPEEEFSQADDSPTESNEPEPAPAAVAAERPISPPPRKRRRFRIPFLMPVLLLAIALALGAIWRFTPVQSQVVGKLTFENYNWTPGTRDGADFEASQRRLLDSDQTRRHAIEFLHRDHPDVAAGFLAVPDVMGRVASSVSLNSVRDTTPAQTSLQLSYSGASKEDDRLRMMSLLQSLYDSNTPILDGNRQLRDAEQRAQQTVDETQHKLDLIKTQLASIQTVIDSQPPAEGMAKLTARKAQLEKARDDSEEAVNRDHNELARLQAAAPEAITASATTPPADPADPQLKQMKQQLADLAAEIDSAHSDQLAGAVMARQQLETTAKQFSEQLHTADEVLGSGSQLRQFVDSARDSQAKARDLINMLIVDGEDLEKQLEDTRRDVEDLIQTRQELKWADDAQLQQLHANLDSAQHRYNANVGDGNRDPRVLDPLQKEIDNWTTQIKARQQQLGVDPSEIKVEVGLNNLIESLRGKLQREKMLIGQVLDPLEKQLNDLDPVVAGMPQAEQDLDRQLRDRLDALNDARQKYAEAVGAGAVAPSAKVTELQKQAAEIKDRIERREQDIAQQTIRSRDAEHSQDVGKAKDALDADQKAFDSAKSAYGQVLLVFEEKQAEHDAAAAAGTKKINLLDAQTAAYTELQDAQRDRDEKQSAAEHAFDIKPVTDADVVVASVADPRMMYSLFVLGAGVILLACLALVSHAAAQRARHSGHHHGPPRIAEQIDTLVLPMAAPPEKDQ